MIEDKARWNEKHVTKPIKYEVSPTLEKYIKHANVGAALDLACGTGRNTHFLEKLDFLVDAVDLSDYALSQIRDTKNIVKIETDLDIYDLKKNSYDLILNCNYLNRRLMEQMIDSLKEGGLLIFETFIITDEKLEQGSMNPAYLLTKNELLNTFINLDVIYYEERSEVNLRGERNKIASLVAKK